MKNIISICILNVALISTSFAASSIHVSNDINAALHSQSHHAINSNANQNLMGYAGQDVNRPSLSETLISA